MHEMNGWSQVGSKGKERGPACWAGKKRMSV